jgi:hypothetical protein
VEKAVDRDSLFACRRGRSQHWKCWAIQGVVPSGPQNQKRIRLTSVFQQPLTLPAKELGGCVAADAVSLFGLKTDLKVPLRRGGVEHTPCKRFNPFVALWGVERPPRLELSPPPLHRPRTILMELKPADVSQFSELQIVNLPSVFNKGVHPKLYTARRTPKNATSSCALYILRVLCGLRGGSSSLYTVPLCSPRLAIENVGLLRPASGETG